MQMTISLPLLYPPVFDHLSHDANCFLDRQLRNLHLLGFHLGQLLGGLTFGMQPLEDVRHVQIDAFLAGALRNHVLYLRPVRLVELDLHGLIQHTFLLDMSVAITEHRIAHDHGPALRVGRLRDRV